VTRPIFAALLLLGAVTLSGCSDSGDQTQSGDTATQERSPSSGSFAESPELQQRAALIEEYQQIQQRLSSLQNQALEDTLLQQDYAVLEARIEQAMTDADPEYPSKRDRFSSLQEEMLAAQQSGDQEAMQRINQQGLALRAELDALQNKALEVEAVAAEIDAFREQVGEKMKELDPEAGTLLDRANAIAESLQAMAPEPPPLSPDGD